MKLTNEQGEELKTYRVWDRPSRIFHWVNLFLVVSLIFVGLLMLFRKDLGINALEAKIKLKELHVVIGYLFAGNLIFRILWGFIGSHFARFSHNIPSLKAIKEYKLALDRGESPQYIGHNPMGKLAVMVIMLMLVVLLATGLFRAGTDIYYPPFGGTISEYIAQDGVDAVSIKPYDETGVDKARLDEIKPYKSIAGKIHLYGAYFLILLIFIHIIAVVYAERKHQAGIISAMFSGKKRIVGKAKDSDT